MIDKIAPPHILAALLQNSVKADGECASFCFALRQAKFSHTERSVLHCWNKMVRRHMIFCVLHEGQQ